MKMILMLEFCEVMITKIDANPIFLYQIIFSVRATFELNDNVNRIIVKILEQQQSSLDNRISHPIFGKMSCLDGHSE